MLFKRRGMCTIKKNKGCDEIMLSFTSSKKWPLVKERAEFFHSPLSNTKKFAKKEHWIIAAIHKVLTSFVVVIHIFLAVSQTTILELLRGLKLRQSILFCIYFSCPLIKPLPCCSCWCVGDLKPSVLANDGWMYWLNGDVLSIQVQPLNKTLKTRMK